MSEGIALAAAGRHAEALEAYLWCLDHGQEVEPSFGAPRLSFLLKYMMDLARVYPATTAELEVRALHAEEEILAGDDDIWRVREFGAINRKLSNGERILRVFDELGRRRASSPALAELLQFAAPLLVEARRYEDLLRAVDVDAMLKSLIQATSGHLQSLQDEGMAPQMVPGLSETLKQGLVKEGGLYYEALLGSGRGEEAVQCAERLLAVHPSGVSVATLIGHAVRAGAVEAARALTVRGLRVVPESERAAVAEAARQIPGGSGTPEEDR